MVRRTVLGAKGIRDQFSWGSSYRELVREGRAEDYITSTWGSHDNRETPIESPYQQLLGVDSDRQARIQELAAENIRIESGIPFVPAYFKAYETKMKTHEHLQELLERRPGQEPGESWKSALAAVGQWLEVYSRYEDLLNKTMIEGFEAKQHALILKKHLAKLRPRDFVRGDYRRDGIKILLPMLDYDKDTNQVIREEVEQTYRSYPELVAAFHDAQKEFQDTFGLREHPAALAWEQLKEFGKSEVGFFLMLSIPFRAIRGAARWTGGTLSWFKSLLIASGQVQQSIEAQAYGRRRLELLHRVLTTRRDDMRYPLLPEETELLTKIESALIDPKLAPRSDAIRKEEAKELRAESWVYGGKDLGKIRIKNTPSTSRYNNRDHALLMEEDERISYFARVRHWITNHKKVMALGIFTTGFGGLLLSQINNITLVINDHPIVTYSQAYLSDSINLLMLKYMNANTVTRKEGRESYRAWHLENPSLWNLLDSHLGRYRERYRRDPTYNFLEDAEFKKELSVLIEKLLDARQEYGSAALFGAGSEYLLKVAYPNYIINEMRDVIKLRYPKEQVEVDILLDHFIENDFAFDAKFLKDYMPGVSEELYYDLRYFFDVSYKDAIEHFKNFGVLFTSRGDAYRSWARASNEFIQKLKETEGERVTRSLEDYPQTDTTRAIQPE